MPIEYHSAQFQSVTATPPRSGLINQDAAH